MTTESPYRRNLAPGGTHNLILRLVPPDSDVLDVGCAAGYLGRDLGRLGCRVWGVDADSGAVASADALGVYEDVRVLDLDGADELPWDRDFDVIIAADVLEHLRSPEDALSTLGRYARPGARVVLSLPNIAHLSVRLPLLVGRFRYGESGILDRTHRRLFTYASAIELVRGAGLQIEAVTGGSDRFGRLLQSRLGVILRGMLAYNIVIVASAPGGRQPKQGAAEANAPASAPS